MKRKLATILIAIIFSYIMLSDNIAANAYAYTNSEFESTEIPTDDNNSILSDITPKIKYLKSKKKNKSKSNMTKSQTLNTIISLYQPIKWVGITAKSIKPLKRHIRLKNLNPKELIMLK